MSNKELEKEKDKEWKEGVKKQYAEYFKSIPKEKKEEREKELLEFQQIEEKEEREKRRKKRRLKERIEKAVLDRKIEQGKTFKETKINYKNYLEGKAAENCVEWVKKVDDQYVCKKCEYKWRSRKSFGEPAICPSCRGDFIVKHFYSNEGKKDLAKSCQEVLRGYLDDLKEGQVYPNNKLLSDEEEIDMIQIYNKKI